MRNEKCGNRSAEAGKKLITSAFHTPHFAFEHLHHSTLFTGILLLSLTAHTAENPGAPNKLGKKIDSHLNHISSETLVSLMVRDVKTDMRLHGIFEAAYIQA